MRAIAPPASRSSQLATFALAAAAIATLCSLGCSNAKKNEAPGPVGGSGTNMITTAGASGQPGQVAGTTGNSGGVPNTAGAGAVVGGSGAATPTAGSGGTGTGSGVACGTKTCAAGQICCNASCGICTPPDGVCTQQICSSPADAAGTPPTTACQKDDDCRLFSDYCTGCDCRALGKTDKDPTCAGPGVRCLVDPCGNRMAICQAGKCTAVTQTKK